MHLVATAAGWGGNPERASIYMAVIPEQNNCNTPHALTAADVPVYGFWSVTVYNEDGFMETNPLDIYSMNNITSKANTDGSVTRHFRACDDGRFNCIPTPENWSYNERLYQPREEILDDSWGFPKVIPVDQ